MRSVVVVLVIGSLVACGQVSALPEGPPAAPDAGGEADADRTADAEADADADARADVDADAGVRLADRGDGGIGTLCPVLESDGNPCPGALTRSYDCSRVVDLPEGVLSPETCIALCGKRWDATTCSVSPEKVLTCRWMCA